MGNSQGGQREGEERRGGAMELRERGRKGRLWQLRSPCLSGCRVASEPGEGPSNEERDGRSFSGYLRVPCGDEGASDGLGPVDVVGTAAGVDGGGAGGEVEAGGELAPGKQLELRGLVDAGGGEGGNDVRLGPGPSVLVHSCTVGDSGLDDEVQATAAADVRLAVRAAGEDVGLPVGVGGDKVLVLTGEEGAGGGEVTCDGGNEPAVQVPSVVLVAVEELAVGSSRLSQAQSALHALQGAADALSPLGCRQVEDVLSSRPCRFSSLHVDRVLDVELTCQVHGACEGVGSDRCHRLLPVLLSSATDEVDRSVRHRVLHEDDIRRGGGSDWPGCFRALGHDLSGALSLEETGGRDRLLSQDLPAAALQGEPRPTKVRCVLPVVDFAGHVDVPPVDHGGWEVLRADAARVRGVVRLVSAGQGPGVSRPPPLALERSSAHRGLDRCDRSRTERSSARLLQPRDRAGSVVRQRVHAPAREGLELSDRRVALVRPLGHERDAAVVIR
eukprot:751286-Hanusia_phi.AAC.7